MTAYPDQRRFLRYQIFDYTAITLEDTTETFHAMLVDIGLGGAQLRSKLPLQDGASILMRIGRNEGEPLEIRGEVRHCMAVPDSDLFGSGIRFTPSTHAERVALAEFVHDVFQRQRDRLIH